jgi:lipopolysaccharide/colanic/teichoic acid biosynthesis glycosyltransferase
MAIPQAHLTRARFGRYPSTVVELVAIGGGWQFTLKEAADRAVALVALLFLAPLLLAIALGVRVSSIGPVIFRQRRVGRGGEAFVLFKFRTMVEDSGVAGFTLARGTAPGGIEGTDRRTTIGRWLRATSLDELPQLVNVLRGEMSLIGPRPERPEYVELFARVVPGYTERLRVKSGITGWAQANGLRGQTSIADRVEFDNYYIENWSLALDLRILALTAVELLRFRDGRSDSLRDRASQHTAVPSFCVVVGLNSDALVADDGSRGRLATTTRRQHVSAVIASFEVAAVGAKRATQPREGRGLVEHHSGNSHRALHACPPERPLPADCALNGPPVRAATTFSGRNAYRTAVPAAKFGVAPTRRKRPARAQRGSQR